jgi:hypothetical protein
MLWANFFMRLSSRGEALSLGLIKRLSVIDEESLRLTLTWTQAAKRRYGETTTSGGEPNTGPHVSLRRTYGINCVSQKLLGAGFMMVADI